VRFELENDARGPLWTFYWRHGIQKVRGSNPLGSTRIFEYEVAPVAVTIGGWGGRLTGYLTGYEPHVGGSGLQASRAPAARVATRMVRPGTPGAAGISAVHDRFGGSGAAIEPADPAAQDAAV
jgi:hypothetical protein